ncbi:ameloblastin isoform X2 [Austrofundulus limnaeus]|uniref:Ameloblastin isoform X2 n=1 Tax=Austrofundulus limnaeus TaxID=52670 RepID=A0A2I4B6B5_AUSLI|nr:PREDICTED: class E vacuolar protein-sorting machinery protein HSE1-like isoform X2 [Austrofundulus limnaeus]
MFILFLLSCLTIMVTSVPVSPNVRPLLLLQRSAAHRDQPVETTNQKSEAQMAAPLLPNAEQPQPGIPQQPDPQTSPQPSLQQYTMLTQGGSPMIIPLPQNLYPSLGANQLTVAQQPMIYPAYGIVPFFPSPYSNQFSPYGFPTAPEMFPPQTPTQQLPNSPVLPAETAVGVAGPAAAPQQQVQQQNPPIVYMIQQPMNPSLGGLSSEELQAAAKMNQFGVYMPSVLANLPAAAGAVQPENQAAGLKKPEQQTAGRTAVASAAGVPPSQGLACSGSQPNANSFPAELKKAAPQAAAIQTPALSKLQPTRRRLV